MRDFMDFDTTPCDENAAQVGRDDYRHMARCEYDALVAQIERTFGVMPPGVSVTCKWCPHDFGSYAQMRMYYDDADQEAVDYVFKVEGEWPAMWDDEARAYLRANNALAAPINPRV